MTDITYGKAQVSDATRISVLLKTVYIQTYAVDGISFEFTNFINKRFSPEHIQHTIQKDPNKLLVAYKKTNPIGVAELLHTSICPIRKIQVPELSKLYILERFLGQGIGYELHKLAEKKILENGHNQLYLQVYLYNERAISFYKRQGYKILGQVDFPMETNTYRNYVMNKVLN